MIKNFALVAVALVASGVQADTFRFKPLSSGATAQIGAYVPNRLQLSSTQPPEIKKVPAGLEAPSYGVLKIGKRSFGVILDAPDGKDQKLYVDANANGDLTDDPAAKWDKPAKADKYVMWRGSASVKLGKMPASLNFYKFDKNDPSRAALKDVLLYYSDYAMQGEVTLGGKKIRALLTDMKATGDFRGAKGSGVQLMLDVNGNGKFDRRGEQYDVAAPFNIGGTTYDLKTSEDGMKVQTLKSASSVAEVLPPPDLSNGKKVIPFSVKDMDGNAIDFPSTYKGKVVLLDFWATWCNPCMAEVPNVVKTYNELHGRGFEILGISLDQANAVQKIKDVTSKNGMTWPQVYDGNYWQAEIAQLYVVDSIPRAFLVDGDTGEILASGDDLREEKLIETVRKALAKKGL
jgi:peroxiredoxin